jgi:hypothetical protein
MEEDHGSGRVMCDTVITALFRPLEACAWQAAQQSF